MTEEKKQEILRRNFERLTRGVPDWKTKHYLCLSLTSNLRGMVKHDGVVLSMEEAEVWVTERYNEL